MDLETVRAYCLNKPAVTESFPFDEDTLVFKVAGKIFALLDLVGVPPGIALKCDPERAVELREQYESVRPGYHLNKKHWNTVDLDGSIPAAEVRAWIDHSYELVVASLTKAQRKLLEE